MITKKNTYIKLINCIIILLIFIILTIIIKKYFTPFFIIIFMALLCKPLYDLLCKRKFFNKKINAVLSIFFVNLLVFFIIFYTGKVFINKITVFLHGNYSELFYQIENILNIFSKNFHIDTLKLKDELRKIYYKLTYNNYLKKGAMYTTNGIFDYLVSNIALYFILVDKYVIFKTINKVFPSVKLINLKARLTELNNVFIVELILVLITTLVTMFGFLVFRMKNVLFLSILCGILDLIPYIGTILVFLPLIVYNFLIKNTIKAVGLIILYVLIQIVRQIFEAKFVSAKLNVHPLIIILGGYIGVKIFGFIGLFIIPFYIVITREIVFSS